MSGQQRAVATLLYSVDYLPGVFALGHQLKKFKEEIASKTSLLLLVSRYLYEDISNDFSIGILRKLFNNIIVVDPVKGRIAGNNENLKLLRRPELHSTLVKARLWELDYDEVLYLDGDTLPLSSDIFKLFDDYPIKKNEVGGAPDVGWPDMFNSGVLLLSPDVNLAHALQQFIANNISMDGADQGILNQFFNAHCSKRESGKVDQRWVRIPFIYNVTMPNYGYQNSPAIKFFRQQCKLIHFIGERKPWRDWCTDYRGDRYYSGQWNKVFLEFQAEYDILHNMCNLKLEPILPTWKEQLTQSNRSQAISDIKVRSPLPAWKESLVQSEQEPERIFPEVPQEPLSDISVPPITATLQFKSVVSTPPLSTKGEVARPPNVERVFPEDYEPLETVPSTVPKK